MTNDSKLKKVIQEEKDKATKLLFDHDEKVDSVTITKWLQSLQRIDDVCKDRNRY